MDVPIYENMAALIAQMRNLWATSGYDTPTVLLGVRQNEWMIVSSDSGTVITFASLRGQTWSAAKSKCPVQTAEGVGTIYTIPEDRAIITSCRTPLGGSNKWAVENLVPLFTRG